MSIEDELDILRIHYDFSYSVEDWLRNYKPIIMILQTAREKIQKYFPSTTRLKLVPDRESATKIWVEIETPLDVDDAMKALNNFDKGWWFNVNPVYHLHLEFSLEFVDADKESLKDHLHKWLKYDFYSL